MTDYSKNVDYAAKDALADGDPSKLILGTEIGGEFDEIVTAIASKYDSSDIASIAEAQALASNTVLITPSRLGSVLNGSGSTAGALGDIAALTDPNADRILFWDDSAGQVDWLSLASNLAITGTQLAVVPGNIDITALLNYSANKFLDHTTISILAGTGLSGGGTIAANRTLSLDINGLTTDGSPDTTADFFATYDTSASAPKKVLMSTLVGVALGDARFYAGTAQSIPANTATTLIYDTQVYNTLTRGSYSVATGVYTAGSGGARLQVTATFTVASLAASRSMTAIITAASVEAARASHSIFGGTETTPTVTVSAVVSLAAAETFFVQGFVTTVANALPAAASGKYNVLNLVEIG